MNQSKNQNSIRRQTALGCLVRALSLSLCVGIIVGGATHATAQQTSQMPDGNLRTPSYAPNEFHVRIKDITYVEGARTNILTGIGLVTGLAGTGGKSAMTRQLQLLMLERHGLEASPETRANVRIGGIDKTNNVSAVTVIAEVSLANHRKGNKVDVLIATTDDAKSLQGGILMPTTLTGFDGEVYAVAAGPLSIGGFSFSGEAASVQKNHPTSGRIPNGATIEKSICKEELAADGTITFNLLNPDLQTANRIRQAIDQFWSGNSHVLDAGSVRVTVPEEHRNNPHGFVAIIQAMRVVPDMEARVVINERTGTIVFGENVRLSRVAITHGNLSVVTGESPLVSQPAPFSDGATTVVPRTNIDVIEESSVVNVLERTVTVGQLARALNTLGVTPRDLGAIFQQLKQSGALHAKLVLE